MADEVQPEAPEAPAKSGSGRLFQLLVIVALMLGEGVAVFFLANAVGKDPTAATAADGTAEGQGEGAAGNTPFKEIELADCRPSNRSSGKTVTVQMKVSGLVVSDQEERGKELAEAHKARILDRVNYVVRSAELQHLNEPGLETIKRRIKLELDQVFGDEELIKEVLIPTFWQSGSGV